MKAMIFAAGLGTRLGDITRDMPKALVKVGGVPMLERVILKLRDAGITCIVVNVHHHAQSIISFLAANQNFGIDIRVSDESDRLLDTGGGLLKARTLLEGDEPVLVHNADILTDFDIRKMQQAHESSSRRDVTLLVSQRHTSRYLLFNNEGRMTGWTNITTGEIRSPFGKEHAAEMQRLAFDGIHIVNPAIFPLLQQYAEAESKFSITPFYTDMCRQLDIEAYTPDEIFHWIDIGKPDSLRLAENTLSEFRLTPSQE